MKKIQAYSADLAKFGDIAEFKRMIDPNAQKIRFLVKNVEITFLTVNNEYVNII